MSAPCLPVHAAHRAGATVVVVLCFMVLFGASPVAAGEGAPLTLDEAVHLAEQQAPIIDAREAAVTAAEDAARAAGQLPDPVLVGGIDNLPVNSGEAFSLTDDFMTMRKIGLMQEFPRREKRRLRSARAAAGMARERALLVAKRLDVKQATAQAWIARMTAERRLELLRALQPRTEASIAATTAMLRAGRATAADGVAAHAQKALLDDRISEATRELEDAQAELSRWLPDAAARPLAAAPDWSEPVDDPDALPAMAAHHRELLVYAADEDVAQADVALARAEKRPDWSLEVDYAQRGPRYSNMISFDVRVPLPLFAHDRQDAQIAAREATAMQVAAERDDALRMHTLQLRKTVSAWRNASERVRRYQRELLPLADDRADAALASYRGGSGDIQAVLAAFDNVVEQRIAYTTLLGTQGNAWAALHFAFPKEH